MVSVNCFDDLPDAELLARLHDAASHERSATAQLIALLVVVEARRLYLAQGCSSLFVYCTQVLHLSEHAAYARIEAARAAAEFPIVLERLEAGTLTLTSVCLLRQHLTEENHICLVDAAAHKSRLEVERLVATLRPQRGVLEMIRRVPGEAAAGAEDAETAASDQSAAVQAPASATDCVPFLNRASIKPLSPDRYWMQLTISAEAHDNLRRVQNLLRHRGADGDLTALMERAIGLLLEQTLKKKTALTDRARANAVTSTHTRPIPAAVKRAVWARDAGRCAFNGRLMRCPETSGLEYHHVVPFAVGGATSVDNIELRCRAHNVYEAREFFGEQDDDARRVDVGVTRASVAAGDGDSNGLNSVLDRVGLSEAVDGSQSTETVQQVAAAAGAGPPRVGCANAGPSG